MRKFTSHRFPFDAPKWQSESYRAQFLARLIATLHSWTVAGVGCGLRQSAFDTVNQNFRLDERFNCFAVCGRDCAVRVRRFIREQYKSDAPIAYIFDRGDEGRGMLAKEMEASGLPTPIFKRSRPEANLDKDDPPMVQLQACDLAAWELRRGKSDQLLGKETRKSLHSLAEMKHRMWRGYEIEDLIDLCHSADIKGRRLRRDDSD
jgi:hypothetical protein